MSPLKTKEKGVDDDDGSVENEAEESRDTFIMGRVKVQVKQSIYRPGQAVKVSGS